MCVRTEGMCKYRRLCVCASIADMFKCKYRRLCVYVNIADVRCWFVTIVTCGCCCGTGEPEPCAKNDSDTPWLALVSALLALISETTRVAV